MAELYSILGYKLLPAPDNNLAMTFFRRAAAASPLDAGIRLNITITLYVQGSRSLAEEEYYEVIQMDSSFRGVLDFLTPRKKDGGN